MLSKKSMKGDYRKWTLWVIAIAIVLRFALAFIYTVSGDACWHLSAARFISNEGRIPLFESIGRDEPFWAPPLFHVIAALFYSLFGNVGLKMVSPIFGSLCLILGFAILRRFLTEKAAFYGMLFFSFLPIMMDYSVLGYGEAILTFFVLLSVYLALEGRFFLGSVAAGLAILTKYNGAFVIPTLLWMAYSSKKRWKNTLLVSFMPILIAAPWFIRNFLVLGNPVWPFLNFLFDGFAQKAYSSIEFAALWSLQTWQALYLGFFGVPDGNMQSLSVVQLPLFPLFFAAFIMGTIVFMVPLFFGWKKDRKDMPLFILLFSFLVLFLVYVANVGPFVSRMLMPALIVFAIVYGRGVERLIGMIKNEKAIMALIILLCVGFALSSASKFIVATNAWSFYQEDFDWVKENTPKDAVFLVGGQCVQFHVERASIHPNNEKEDGFTYIWQNQEMYLDVRSKFDEGALERLKNVEKEGVYSNLQTKTEIYRVT